MTEPCVQPAAGMLDGLADGRFTPHSELAVVLDADGARHVTELAPGREAAAGPRRQPAPRAAEPCPAVATPRPGDPRRRRERGAPCRRAVLGHPGHGILAGAPRSAPDYSETVAELVGAHFGTPPRVAWDLYGGAGVFAGALLDGPGGLDPFTSSIPIRPPSTPPITICLNL